MHLHSTVRWREHEGLGSWPQSLVTEPWELTLTPGSGLRRTLEKMPLFIFYFSHSVSLFAREPGKLGQWGLGDQLTSVGTDRGLWAGSSLRKTQRGRDAHQDELRA